MESLDTGRAKGRAAFGFITKLHDRAKSFILESLDIKSGKSGQESRQVLRCVRIKTKILESRREFESGMTEQKVCKS